MRRKEIRMTVFCLPISLFSHSLSSFPFLSFPVFSFFFSLLAVWDMLLNCEKITHHPEPEGRGNLVGVFSLAVFSFSFLRFFFFSTFSSVVGGMSGWGCPLLAILLLGWSHHLFLDINGCFPLFGEIPTECSSFTWSDK